MQNMRSLKIKSKYNGGMVERNTPFDLVMKVIVYFVLIIVAAVSIIPMWHVIMSSFSDGQALQALSGVAWHPIGSLNFGGYSLTFQYDGVVTGYVNTLIYTVAGTMFSLFISILGGYVMARHSMLKKPIVVFVLLTMLFSGGMVPTFMVVKSLGLVGTRLAIILPTAANAIYILLMMNAFRGINPALIEAAEMDGAGHFRIMFQVMLPQVTNMLFVIALFTIVQYWNSWLEASMYLADNRELWPLQLWIRDITNSSSDWGQTTNPDYNRALIPYSVIVIAVAPIIILATVFQKWIERGALIGGVKE